MGKNYPENLHVIKNTGKDITIERYTSLILTISHDNNNHRTSKHASKSWRFDGSPSWLGGSSHGWVPVKTHSAPVPTSVNSPAHNNESKKTQHDNKMVAEQVLCDLSVRRTSVVRSFGEQSKCVFMECADVPDVSKRSEVMISPMSLSRAERL